MWATDLSPPPRRLTPHQERMKADKQYRARQLKHEARLATKTESTRRRY